MKRNLFIILASFIFVSCNTSSADKAASPGEVIIQSLKEKKFEVLESLLPTKEVYKAVATEEKPESFIDSFIVKNKERFKQDWEKVAETVKSKSIDLSTLKIKDWLIYNPFKNENKNVQAGVLVYEYDGKTWDDIMILVATVNGKTHLLQFPNPTRAFSFSDSSLRNVSDAKLYKELSDTTFRQKMQDKVKELIGYAQENKTEQLTLNSVYNGDDEARRWKSALNPSEVKEFERGSELIKQINAIMESCTTSATFDSFDYERESEGVWLVQKMKCGNKNIFFAFLQINGKLLLGEVNADQAPGY
jgi:hypothetical protein